MLITPTVPDAVDVLESKAAAAVVFEVAAVCLEEHPLAVVISAKMVVDAAKGVRATAGTVKYAKWGGDSKGIDDGFTLIVVVPIALLSFAALSAPVVLGATVFITFNKRLADALPNVVSDAAVANDDYIPVRDIDAGTDANIIAFVTDV